MMRRIFEPINTASPGSSTDFLQNESLTVIPLTPRVVISNPLPTLCISACSSATCRSRRCISCPVPRPRVRRSPSKVRSLCSTAPDSSLRINLISTFTASPVQEYRDHVGKQGRDKRKGQRHMQIKPDLQSRVKTNVIPQFSEYDLLGAQHV